MSKAGQSSEFLGGVVEGFYGQPWKQAQRIDLFHQLSDLGLNTYFYAPKDDLKHRALWREPYDAKELQVLRELVEGCRAEGIQFVYGLSPGLDICFSDSDEMAALQNKLTQLFDLGAQHFALLFDDLPGKMSPADQATYSSVAAAQCDVANQVFRWRQASVPETRMLFCPTPYCQRMVQWKLAGENYLGEIGSRLDKAIDIFWTGPEIISETISVESIRELAQQLQRKPVLWDNLHANDYDMRRLYCGPYSGRDGELLEHLNGILINPNNEFPINYVALRTLSRFVAEGTNYDADAAYNEAIEAWAGHYTTATSQVSVEDLRFLTDCYYLPFSEGETAIAFADLVDRLLDANNEHWDADRKQLERYNERVSRLSEQLTQLDDRELFYAWSRRIWELREDLDLLVQFFKQQQAGAVPARVKSEHHLPGTYRGGFVAKLQQKLFMKPTGELCVSPPSMTE